MKFSEDVLALNPGLAQTAGSARTIAGARATPFRSKLEERAWNEWVLTRGAMIAQYEPFTLHLAGGNYTPDFVLVFEDGERWIVEVKGSWRAHLSGRSSKRNLRQAAFEFSWLGRFFSLLPDGKAGWNLTEITPPAHYRRVTTELSE
jgi:hypothetical protein